MEKTSFWRRTLKSVTGLKSRKAFALPYIFFMTFFVVLPLAVVLISAFLAPDENGTLRISLSNFGKILGGEIGFFPMLWRSLWVGIVNSALCLLIGYPIAYFLSNAKYNKTSTAYMLFVLPIWMNFLIRTVATKALFDAVGIELGGMGPVIFGMVYNFLPFMILPIYNVLTRMDKNLIEAASDLGANYRQVFTKTIIPLSMPGVVSGFVMVFMPTISTYVISDLLSYNQITLFGNLINKTAGQTSANSYYLASGLSMIMLIFIGAIMLFSNKFDKLGDSKGEGLW
jgi:spermidine/putrescine transport system permease protein